MPGSAIMDPNILVDDLTELVDDLRQDLNTEFGTRAYRVYTVARVWDGGAIGVGVSSETETELTPQPLVKPYLDSLGYSLEPCGLDEAGFVRVEEISLTYTQEELTGKPVTGEVEGSTAGGTQWVIRIREAHGQLQSFKDFKLQAPPYPDRLPKTFGWILKLIKVEE